MATLPPNYSIHPRSSTETDRRHLLADSVSPSESASMIIDYADGDRTPRAHSPARLSVSEDSSSQVRIPAGPRRETIADPTPKPRPYRGFPSEAHYLAALHEWAESKKYVEPDTVLYGFYGTKTMNDYASEPKLELGGLGLKKKWKARREKKEEEKKMDRRNNVT